jgi:prephenate dehydratase
MKKTIAFQGLIGANSYLACKKFYPDFETKAFHSFFEVFQAVEKGEVDYGMIPLENSSAGRVSEIHNLLQQYPASIVAEHFLEIKHYLAALKEANFEDIKQVYSHPQALMQCKNNLRELNLKTYESSNTAEAARMIAESNDKSKAAICSKQAAEFNGLKILKSDMQDIEGNATIFIVISKNMIDPDPKIAPVIISLIFTIKNYPGSLYKAIGSFATNSVSMMQIESFIKGGVKAFGGISEQAAFFVTIQGHIGERNIINALQELEFFAEKVKILGVYHADELRFSNHE